MKTPRRDEMNTTIKNNLECNPGMNPELYTHERELLLTIGELLRVEPLDNPEGILSATKGLFDSYYEDHWINHSTGEV